MGSRVIHTAASHIAHARNVCTTCSLETRSLKVLKSLCSSRGAVAVTKNKGAYACASVTQQWSECKHTTSLRGTTGLAVGSAASICHASTQVNPLNPSQPPRGWTVITALLSQSLLSLPKLLWKKGLSMCGRKNAPAPQMPAARSAGALRGASGHLRYLPPPPPWHSENTFIFGCNAVEPAAFTCVLLYITKCITKRS